MQKSKFVKLGHLFNGRVSDKPRRLPRRLPRHQRAQAHNRTHYRRQLSFMYWLCSKQNCLLCAYEHDFGENFMITMGRLHLTKLETRFNTDKTITYFLL
jgi:hypothetical protein